MSTLAVQFHLNGYLAPFYLFMTARVLCNPFNFILGTMQPVISFWVLCNPFNLFGYYATRLICFLGYYATRYFDFGYYATRFKLFLPLGTMHSSFGYYATRSIHFRGTMQPAISLSDPSFCTTMQHVTLSQPIYFLSIGYYTTPYFIIGYHDYATLSGTM